MPEGSWPSDPVERAAEVAGRGLRRPVAAGTTKALRSLLAGDGDARVRSAALGALVRLSGVRSGRDWARAMADPAPAVRRRACEVAPAVQPQDCGPLVEALSDPEPSVAEAAAFALGELGPAAQAAGAVAALSQAGRHHTDPLVREAAIAALGSLGDPAGLPAVLAGCRDRPAVRRRAVVALAAFDGPQVEATLQEALSDRDWQVRQAAEDLLGSPPAQ